MLARTYLRASTDEQDATRARAAVESFAAEHGLNIVGTHVENESGAKLARPELFRLIADSRPGDVLLIEQVDRLSRLTAADWQKLRADLDAKQIRVVALDLPTSWMLVGPADDFTGRMFRALNSMMLDMLAAVARKDYDDRRRRQAEGIAKGKAAGLYRGRPEDSNRQARRRRLDPPTMIDPRLEHRRNVCRERVGREAGAAGTVSAHRRFPARRRAAYRAGRPVGLHGGICGAKASKAELPPHVHRAVAIAVQNRTGGQRQGARADAKAKRTPPVTGRRLGLELGSDRRPCPCRLRRCCARSRTSRECAKGRSSGSP
jgi:DNA invertase Pin-like site-specific DNA recombinase